MSIPFPVIMGPTASGKSALALEVARKMNGEILSADSMQIYRGLNIGTAKPTEAERHEVVHHLVDCVDFTEKYDVFRFAEEAEHVIHLIRERGHLPVAAGGTGLYLRALLYGLDEMPADVSLRKQLDEAYDNAEGYPLLEEIAAKEMPADFEKFDSNRRKLIRAREVFLLTGKQMSELQSAWKNRPPRKDACSFVLDWDGEALHERIAQRCHAMLRSGWIGEAEHFLKSGLGESPTAWQALGYRQIGEYLRGERTAQSLPEAIINATWQFARRQRTWFRTQHPEAVHLVMPDSSAAGKIAEILSAHKGE